MGVAASCLDPRSPCLLFSPGLAGSSGEVASRAAPVASDDRSTQSACARLSGQLFWLTVRSNCGRTEAVESETHRTIRLSSPVLQHLHQHQSVRGSALSRNCASTLLFGGGWPGPRTGGSFHHEAFTFVRLAVLRRSFYGHQPPLTIDP